MDRKPETRVYHITGETEQLDVLEKVLGYMEYLGSAGSSRDITLGIDGDGGARLKCRSGSGQKLGGKGENIKNFTVKDSGDALAIFQ